jgi:hypothetical protein
MEVIHVNARPDDLKKLFKCVAAFRPSAFVRCQVARDDVWKRTGTGERTKIPAATEVSRRVYHSRLTEIWVAARCVFSLRASAVTAIAVSLRIDNIAPQSHECPVFAFQIQLDRGYRETNFDSGVGAIIIRVSTRRLDRHSQKNNRNERHNNSPDSCTRLYRHLVSPLHAC